MQLKPAQDDDPTKPSPRLHYSLTTLPMAINAGRRMSLSITVVNLTDELIELDALDISLPNGPWPTDLSDGFEDVHFDHPEDWHFAAGETPGVFHAHPKPADKNHPKPTDNGNIDGK